MMQWKKLLVSMAATAMLVACGGGGDDDESAGGDNGGGDGGGVVAVADKYAGTWSLGCTVYGEDWAEKETLVLTKTGDDTVSVQVALTEYDNVTCSGEGSTQNFTGTATIEGPIDVTFRGKTETFDKITAVIAGEGTLKWTGSVRENGTQLVIDFVDNDEDSSTVYPTNADDGETVYTKV